MILVYISLFFMQSLIITSSFAENSKPVLPTGFALKGCIQAPEDWNCAPEFRIFFDGKQAVSNQDGFYTLPIDKNQEFNKLSILVCKGFDEQFDNVNTIENLTITKEKPYMFFSLKKTGTDNNLYKQKAKNLDKKSFVVPQNCVIVKINPKYVESVENWPVRFDKNFIKLPKIVLKKTADEKQLKRQSAKSLLYSFDLFHEPVVEKKLPGDPSKNVRVSLAQ